MFNVEIVFLRHSPVIYVDVLGKFSVEKQSWFCKLFSILMAGYRNHKTMKQHEFGSLQTVCSLLKQS